MKNIYLDYAATTPVDTRVIEIMQPYFNQIYGNPSSLHQIGQRAEAALEKARRMIADQINAKPDEIVFTSCGSESDNLALRGIVLAAKNKGLGKHLVTSPIEHPAVLETAKQLADHFGVLVSYLQVNEYGEVIIDDLLKHMRDDISLVSVMAANNEIGTLNPIREIGEICREEGIPFHTDAVQYAAHYPLDVEEMKLDLVSLGAHKFYGPKGVGALYIRDGLDVMTMQTGGSQEFGYRAATQNIPLIVGMAEAFRIIQDEGSSRLARIQPLRDQIIDYILKTIPDSKLTGAPRNRLPNHTSFVFKGVDGNLLIQVLDTGGFAVSSGSACKTGDPQPSAVLSKLGIKPEWALGSLRITLGKDTTKEEVEKFLEILPEAIAKVRGITK